MGCTSMSIKACMIVQKKKRKIIYNIYKNMLLKTNKICEYMLYKIEYNCYVIPL